MSVDFDNLLIGIGRILSPGRRVRITGLLFFRGFFVPSIAPRWVSRA